MISDSVLRDIIAVGLDKGDISDAHIVENECINYFLRPIIIDDCVGTILKGVIKNRS